MNINANLCVQISWIVLRAIAVILYWKSSKLVTEGLLVPR